MTETSSVTTPIRKALNALPFAICERMQAGTMRSGKVRLGSAGCPDLVATIVGVTVYIETKAPGGRLSEAQRRWHDRARRAGAFVVVMRSPREAVEMARKLYRTGGMAGVKETRTG